MVRVLHVTECFDAGVGRAIQEIVRATPEHEHHLLWEGEEDPNQDFGFVSITRFRRSTVRRFWQVRHVAKSLCPEVIHAHSSWAGAYVRVLPVRAKVIYQPHAYIFANPHIGAIQRSIFQQAERYFAKHTDLIVAVSPTEKKLARSLSAKTPVRLMPNVPSLRPHDQSAKSFPSPHDPVTVAMTGRICQQKDPAFYAEVCSLIRRVRPDIQCCWFGDGDVALKELLRRAGVNVTGWLERDQMHHALATTTVYFHSACYEGFPLSVLEAAAFGLPIVVRTIPAFDQVDLQKGTSEQECAMAILEVLGQPNTWRHSILQAARLDDMSRPENRAKLLGSVYQTILDR